MGCQSGVTLEKNLVFSICCHDPDTGVLVDADAAPSYRIYEDETTVPILTGTMSTLDTANTTGFYTELIACTTANGFEVGKSYTVYIVATVDSDTGGICYGFTVEQLAGVPKNVALSNFTLYMVLSSDHITAATGKVVTGERSLDGAAFAACTNAVAEIGNGVYKINLTQAEMNANVITLKFTEATCDQRTITIKTSI